MVERVVNLGGLRDVFVAQLAASYELLAIDDPRAAEATAAVTTGGIGISAQQIAALPRLRNEPSRLRGASSEAGNRWPALAAST